MRFICFWVFCLLPAWAQSSSEVCPRQPVGSAIQPPAELRSSNGILNAGLTFRTFVDSNGLTRYCYIYQNSVQAPTLRVNPGDELILTLKNELPVSPVSNAVHSMSGHSVKPADPCAASSMTASSTNLHFHGLNVPPSCHQDEVIHTLIEPTDAPFEYRLKIPRNEPPGLYWYHPHPHGMSEGQVLGGASGALIVEGIQHINPAVAGLPERVLVLRDQIPGGGALAPGSDESDQGKDLTINYVPIPYPLYQPATLNIKPGQREFWRVLNAAADTFFDLQIVTGSTIQNLTEPLTLQLIAMDGVAVDAGAPAAISNVSHILLGPGTRAEFIVATPPAGTLAQFVTLGYDSGPFGETILRRTLATITVSPNAPDAPSTIPNVQLPATPQRFAGLLNVAPVLSRNLYFSEVFEDPTDPNSPASYFITVDGMQPKVFDMNSKQPDITAQSGTVEDWTIENRATEAHVFHIHQLHFQLLERDGIQVDEPMMRDTIDLPYWDGRGPYPSVKLRMDFRDREIVGTFVYHCHSRARGRRHDGVDRDSSRSDRSAENAPVNKRFRNSNFHAIPR